MLDLHTKYRNINKNKNKTNKCKTNLPEYEQSKQIKQQSYSSATAFTI